jgi:hypothetical protein
MRQPIAAARHGYDVAVAPAALVQRLAQRRDVDVQIVFRDHALWPQPCHQLVLADHAASCRCKQAEDIERPPADLYRLAIVQQTPPSEVEPEPTEANLLRIIRKGH